ncbi:MAG: sulfotransferase family protein [Fimbriimonas ginsengisoli]|uniref:Sulfotransferase family protein n=1 Tax=Fimbriimonas ginsengisoli TaxID=1005039 RepID=A0A931LRT1_FIMGI|nr:sulfotransferase family protein [Fimbriimonas ginsengisoli]
MSLKVIGAEVGRTGTYSLKLALERLLGGPCYHMVEVFEQPEHVPMWHAAAKGEAVDWDGLFEGYSAAVDWPASAFWPELSRAYPEAVIVLSKRSSDSWWSSASETIFSTIDARKGGDHPDWYEMVMAIFDARFTCDLQDREACVRAYERHNAEVERTAPADRLVVWEAKDGWAPRCSALSMPVPDEPFPHSNTKEEFIARTAAFQAEAASK